MSMLSHWRKYAALVLVLLVCACGGAGSSSSPPAGGITVTPGNGQVTIQWTADPGVEYWLMYAATATPIDMKNPPVGHVWATKVTSPYVITGLANGVTYSFALNGRSGGGPGGAQTASIPATPRYAGSTWIAGTGIPTASTPAVNLRGVSFGTSAADSLNYFVAVGDSGTIYKSQDGVTQGISGYSWSQVTTGPTIDFKAATTAFSRFLAVGANGTNNITSSADLATWTPAVWTTGSSAANAGFNALASNGTIVVAVGNAGNVFTTSDGLNWAQVTTLPAAYVAANFYGLAYSRTVGWVVVGAGGAVLTSPDLVTWSTPVSGAINFDLNGIAVNASNLFVAVGAGGKLIESTDGANWSAATQLATGNLFAVSTDSAQFLAVGATGTVFTSPDGATWTAIPASQTNATMDLMAIVGGTSKYMVVGKSGASISSIH